jgi:hypothetical protein
MPSQGGLMNHHQLVGFYRGDIMRKQRLFIVGLVLLICLLVYGCSPTPPSSGELINLVQNGSFENTGSNWLAPWGFQSSGIATIKQVSDTKANGVYSASVNITKSSSADNAVQLYQANIPLVGGESYMFVFWAKASASRTIRPAIVHGAFPPTSYFSQYVTLTTAWQQYTLRFTAPQTDTHGTLLFNMAHATGVVWIDNVSLYQYM